MLVGVIIGAVAVTAVGAVAGFRAYDAANYAEVISATPAMETVSVPRQECRDVLVEQQEPTKDPKQIAGTVAGAVIGGVLGSQVGGGSGKKIATVGGAVAGGYAGNKIQEGMQERNTSQQLNQVCKTVYDEHQEQVGFDVTYRLNGDQNAVRMDHDPVDRIPLHAGQLCWMNARARGRKISRAIVQWHLRYLNPTPQVHHWQLLFPARALSSGPCSGSSAHTGYTHDRDLAPR
jgi:uncharacterized protein YcfJ